MSYILLDYECRAGHLTESLQDRSAQAASIHCPACPGRKLARRVLSPVKERKVWGTAAVRGKSDPPPSPYAMDAVGKVGESRSAREWRDGRSKMWKEFDRNLRRKKGAPT